MSLIEECAFATGDRRSALSGELWLILRGALLLNLRRAGPGLAEHREEVFEDLASEKALELLLRVEREEWSAAQRSPGEIVTYLRQVAKNALVDNLRKRNREATHMSEGLPAAEARLESSSEPADARVAGRESAAALRTCVEALQQRSRTVWYLRVFLGLSTKEIAVHPEVRLKGGHVDVILQRARNKISTCMRSKGFSMANMPTGSFSEIWAAMQEWKGVFK